MYVNTHHKHTSLTQPAHAQTEGGDGCGEADLWGNTTREPDYQERSGCAQSQWECSYICMHSLVTSFFGNQKVGNQKVLFLHCFVDFGSSVLSNPPVCLTYWLCDCWCYEGARLLWKHLAVCSMLPSTFPWYRHDWMSWSSASIQSTPN